MVDPEHPLSCLLVVNNLRSEVNPLRPGSLREDVGDEGPLLEVRRGVEVDGVVRPEAAVAELKVDAGTVAGGDEASLQLTVSVAHPKPVPETLVLKHIPVVNIHQVSLHISPGHCVVNEGAATGSCEGKQAEEGWAWSPHSVLLRLLSISRMIILILAD